MKLRILERSELDLVEPLLKEHGGALLPNSLFIVVAEIGDEIVGMLTLEFAPHVGQLWVKENCRRQGIAKSLYQKLESYLDQEHGSGYYTFPSNEASKAVAKSLGLTPTGWEVWKREF